MASRSRVRIPLATPLATVAGDDNPTTPATTVGRNRAVWNASAARYAEPGRRNWAAEPSWGIRGILESGGRAAHPPDVADPKADREPSRAARATCRPGLHRSGARPVGIDLGREPARQRARAARRSTTSDFLLDPGQRRGGAARRRNFLRPGHQRVRRGDLVRPVSAGSFEAARLLPPPGGRLILRANGALLMLTMTGFRRRRDWRGRHSGARLLRDASAPGGSTTRASSSTSTTATGSVPLPRIRFGDRGPDRAPPLGSGRRNAATPLSRWTGRCAGRRRRVACVAGRLPDHE